MAKSFTWITPPNALQKGIAEHGAKVAAAVIAIANRRAMEAQNDMRRNASWTDRTGNARSGLFTKVEVVNEGTAVIVWFSHGHTIDYGIYLETSYAGKYAIIVPTMSSYGPKVMNDIRGLLK